MNNKISSLHHPLVKHFVKLREKASYRKEQDSVLVMGDTLINELPVKPKNVLTIENSSIEILKKISGLTSFSESIAEVGLPKPTSVGTVSSLLVIDQISDPGNLGTLLRTALALNWGGVFLLPNSVDPFNDKVMRASRAALFKLPWQQGSFEELQELVKRFTPLIADIKGTNLKEIGQPKHPLLVLSHEAHGVSDQMAQLGQKVTVPMANMESLNVAVAGSILMYGLWTTN